MAGRLARAALPAVAFGVAFTLSILIGRATRVEGSEVSLVWPAAAVAVLWGLHIRTLPRAAAVAHAALFALLTLVVTRVTGAAWDLSAWFVLVNAGLAGVATAVLGRGGGPVALRDPTDLRRLVVAVGAGTLVAAALATAFFVHAGQEDPPRTFALFAVRNGVTALAGVALVMRLKEATWRWPRPSPAQLLEGLVCLVVTVAIFGRVYWFNPGLPTAFAVMLPAMWIALRYPTTTSTLFLSAAGASIVWATLLDRGALTGIEPHVQALLAQGMVGSLTMVVLSLALFRDSRDGLIVQLEAARRRAGEEAGLLADVLGAASELSIIGTDPEGRITVFNVGAERMLGWSCAAMIGQTPAVLHDPRELADRADQLGIEPGFEVLIHDVAPGSSDEREWTYVRRDGSTLPVSLTVSAMRIVDGRPSGYIGIATDITARKQSEAELHHLASHDPLTGLANRTLLTHRLEEALTRRPAPRIGLIFLDLDGFKQVNDSWGHSEGDGVLIRVAERLRAAVRPDDTVARIGGDEFAVLCLGVGSRNDLEALAERIRLEVRQPYPLESGEQFTGISGSIGVALADRGCTATTLLKHADHLMYRSKQGGKDCVTLDGEPATLT
ncbi:MULTISPECIES: diguanylate cyclase domain-containing protein [unclassified Nocardioides]|uniref:diguanylate cyclase domain-containing protein n=1 Tax=unclassified Nocardioides TaxID=2615069 RepID=UPI0009EBB039|nr:MULTISPECIES: diguanylate cyclase [unclassified Nocardioides]